MSFQASDKKGCNFLDLDNDDEGKPIEPCYKKRGAWLKYFGHSNSTCNRMTRLITNHTPIGEYRQWFFSSEEALCYCRIGTVETRHYILYECNKYSKAWQSPDNSISSLLTFLQGNSNAFCFNND